MIRLRLHRAGIFLGQDQLDENTELGSDCQRTPVNLGVPVTEP